MDPSWKGPLRPKIFFHNGSICGGASKSPLISKATRGEMNAFLTKHGATAACLLLANDEFDKVWFTSRAKSKAPGFADAASPQLLAVLALSIPAIAYPRAYRTAVDAARTTPLTSVIILHSMIFNQAVALGGEAFTRWKFTTKGFVEMLQMEPHGTEFGECDPFLRSIEGDDEAIEFLVLEPRTRVPDAHRLGSRTKHPQRCE